MIEIECVMRLILFVETIKHMFDIKMFLAFWKTIFLCLFDMYLVEILAT